MTRPRAILTASIRRTMNSRAKNEARGGCPTLLSALAPNSYVAIFGKNLSTTSPGRSWTGADFTSNSNGTLNMPTSLDGTSVTIGGAPAYISYVSTGQLNVITPPNVTGLNIPMAVTVNGQVSPAFNVT